MSSFLAPIHFWLYGKINLQEELVRDIANAAQGKGYIQDAGAHTAEPLPELSSAIDLGNIHGWLQDKITESEKRLARLVTESVRADETRLSFIEETARSFGLRHAVPVNADAHKAVNDSLVNGMPCDTVESVTETSPDRVAWKSVADLHAPHWTEIGGNPKHYWRIRSAVISGMLEGSSLEFTPDGWYTIRPVSAILKADSGTSLERHLSKEQDMYDTTLTLSNGVTVPQLALGTWLMDDSQAEGAVKSAIALGYRHIDTAQAYGNEAGVGKGVRESGVKREDVFVTSKVAAELKSYKAAADSIDESLAKLNLGYIDLMIIHSPQPWAEVNQSQNRYPAENREVWRALEEALAAGKVRAIGVSNFLQGDIENIFAVAKVRPMVNQILCHIANTPLALIDFCNKSGIVTEAYSPVAHGEALKSAGIAAMAQKYGVSVAQLCIRYCLQLGMITLPKAVNPAHQKANAEVGFEISAADMEALKRIETIKDYGDASVFLVFGGKL